MKLHPFSFALPLLVSLITACTENKHVEIAEHVHYDLHDNAETVLQMDCLEYDSVIFSDGSYATYLLRNTPQNSLYTFYDKDGYTIATLAQASECEEQVIVYQYDDAHRLTGLLSFDDKIDNHHTDWYGSAHHFDFVTFRNKIDSVDFNTPDFDKYKYVTINYDSKGRAVRMTYLNAETAIVAPAGYVLDISVDPCEIFWASDITGGHYNFNVCVKPADAHASNSASNKSKCPTPLKYVNFKPAGDED